MKCCWAQLLFIGKWVIISIYYLENRNMYKIKPTSNSKIAQGSSKKVIKSALPSIHK